MGKFIFSNQKGQAVILTSAVCLLLLVMLALVVDMGNLYLQKTKLQTAVDAAALAGAQSLPGSTANARDAANQYMLNNGIATTATITFAESNSKIIVTVSQNVPTYFLRVIGTKTVAVGVTAMALNSGGGGGAFDYAIFYGATSGSPQTSGNNIIKGSIHSNSNFNIWGSPKITGNVEAVGKIQTGGGQQVGGSIIQNASAIDMPDYSSVLKAAAQQAGKTYSGNQTLGGSGGDGSYTLDGTTYVKGNVTLNGITNISSTGAILADGSITINSDVRVTGAQSSDKQVCFYSANGDITVGSTPSLSGIIYAPNGTVTIGGNLNLTGCIVAKYINFWGSPNINRTDFSITSLPVGGHVKLVK